MMKRIITVSFAWGIAFLLWSSLAWSAIRVVDTAYNTTSNDAALASGSWTGGRHSGIGSAGTISTSFVSTGGPIEPFGNQNYSIQINYDVTMPNGYVWFIDGVASDWGNVDVDLSAYNYLSFWVRGAVGGEGFQIGLGNTSTETRMQVNQFLPGGITTRWRKVVIPLNVLEKNTTFLRSAVSKIAFVVDGSALKGAASGTVYLDDITFGVATAPVWVANYDYGDVQTNGTTLTATKGVAQGFGTNLATTYYAVTYTSAPYSFECDYHIADASNIRTFAHILNASDLTWCTTLNFDVRGASGGENPDVRLRQASPILDEKKSLASYVSVSASQFIPVSIPLSDYTTIVNRNNLSECAFDIPVSTAGKIYVDNLRFEDASIPTQPTAMTFNGAGVSDGFNISVQSGSVAVAASAITSDAKMERVVFEYSGDGGATWIGIGSDYATTNAKTSFGASWNLSTLPNGPYQLRAAACHVGGTSTVLSHSVVLNFGTPTHTATITQTSTITPTLTASPTITMTPTITPTPSITNTSTHSPTCTITPTITPTASISATSTHSATYTSTPSVTQTATITPSRTSSPTPSVTPTLTISPTPEPGLSATSTVTPSASATPFAQEIRVGRNGFNPAQGQVLPLVVQMTDRGLLRITVYNRLGDKIVELYNQEAGPGAINLSWDGKNSSGQEVASGVYVIFTDMAGQKSKHLVAVIH